jgi:hypothetical protein
MGGALGGAVEMELRQKGRMRGYRWDRVWIFLFVFPYLVL